MTASTPTFLPQADMSDTQKDQIGKALGRVASGTYVVTAFLDNNPVGMLASWVQQASFDPPTLSMGIHPDRELFKAISQSKRFVVNVLSRENMDLLKRFSRYSPEQFDGVLQEATPYGVVLNDAVSCLSCEFIHAVPAGDHQVLIASIVDGKPLNEALEPMVHLRKSGFSY